MTVVQVQANPYPKYKASGVAWLGDIPEQWAVKRLKYSATINNEALPESTDPAFELTYVDISSVDAVRGVVATEEMVFEDAPSRARRIVRNGDTIVSTVRTYLRAIAPIRDSRPNTIVSTGFAVVRPRKMEPGFASYALRESGFVEAIVARSVGVSYPAVNASEIGAIPIPLPSSEEQRAIADFLDRETGSIDSLVAKKRTLIERLKEKRTALISRTVTRGLPPAAARAAGLDPHPKLKPSGIDWLGDVPEHWGAAQLRRFIRFITSGSRGWAEYYADEGAIFVRITNLTRDSIRVDLSNIQHVDPPSGAEGERTRVVANDVLFSITAYLGSVGVADEAIAGAYINQHIALVRLGVGSVTPRFVAYAVLADIGQAQLAGQAYGGTKVQLGLDDVKSLWLPVPRLLEQHAIAVFLDRETAKIDAMLTKVETAIERLQEYRTALITASVTGKIDVRRQTADNARETVTAA